MSTNCFLGFRMEIHPQWRERVSEPKAPGNYKKPESIQKYIDEKWAEMEHDPFSFPLITISCPNLSPKPPSLAKIFC